MDAEQNNSTLQERSVVAMSQLSDIHVLLFFLFMLLIQRRIVIPIDVRSQVLLLLKDTILSSPYRRR